jgi:hypothetical protein
MAKKKTKKQNKDISGQFFVGAILIGIGIGALAGNIWVGAVLGVGVGFILKGLIDHKMK